MHIYLYTEIYMYWHCLYCISLIAIFFQIFILWAKPQSRFLQLSLTIPNFDYKLQVTSLQLAIAKRKRRRKKPLSRNHAVAWSQLNFKEIVKRHILRITVSSIALQIIHLLQRSVPFTVKSHTRMSSFGKWKSDRLTVANTGSAFFYCGRKRCWREWGIWMTL